MNMENYDEEELKEKKKRLIASSCAQEKAITPVCLQSQC